MGIETALIIGAAASAGSAVYQSKQASKARKEAKREAEKQAAIVAKQQAKIDAERRKQTEEAQARRQRAMSKDLLTGTETGIMEEPTATLLK